MKKDIAVHEEGKRLQIQENDIREGLMLFKSKAA
jgi:hypothetical protein